MARTSQTPQQRGRHTAPRRRTSGMLALGFGIIVLLVLGGIVFFGRGRGATAVSGASEAGGVEMPHLHGLGYSADGRQLLVPAHEGLRIFADGAWHTPDTPANDYMGFAATDDGFYSSGHPAPGSNLINPLGLVKSADGGATLTKLGFEGESDFHGMAVGYKNHAIYVLNPEPNSKLGTGMYYSLDDGTTWQPSTAQGVSGEPIQLAVHPIDARTVALATDQGLLLSPDHGNTFTSVPSTGQVTAATFRPDGTRLLFGSTTLSVYDTVSKEITTLPTPQIGSQDAISYIAVNPAQPQERAIATFNRNIYRSQDGGQTWQQIARDGVGLSME